MPGSPDRPLAVLRRWGDFGGGRAGRQVDADDIVVVVADANAAAERGCRIGAGAPAGLHRETATLGARRPGRPSGPTAVNGAIRYPDTRARTLLPAVLRRRIVALSGLTLARVDLLQMELSEFSSSTPLRSKTYLLT